LYSLPDYFSLENDGVTIK